MKPIFLVSSLIALSCANANAAVHANCLPYGDCDMLVACELVYDVRNAIAGGAVDYNTTVAGAILSKDACRNYANDFVRNIDTVVYDNPTVNLTINWDTVRNLANQGFQQPTAAAEKLSGELDSLLPWYGILVVKKGSLDKYANADVPIISSEYMKRNKDAFYPGNSGKTLGMLKGCTHGNHTANDGDVVNRAAHLTFEEDDSFWSGNDYYVYDGEDVYWGTTQLVGEIALALITFGASSSVSASKATAQGAVATDRAIKAQKAITLATRAENLKKAETAALAANDVTKANKAARLGLETRKAARLALEEAGSGNVSALTNTNAIGNMGRLLQASGVAGETIAGAKPLTWVSALSKPWRMVKPGLATLSPKNITKAYGPGVSWGKRIKRAALTAGGVGLGVELVKAFGYSSAAASNYADGVSFNSFGLLSADDLEGRDNVVSHGAWITFEEGGAVQEDDPLKEASAFAEAFAEDMNKINAEDPMCDVDIYVVQPGISNPQKMGTKEIYYLIQNQPGAYRVNGK